MAFLVTGKVATKFEPRFRRELLFTEQSSPFLFADISRKYPPSLRIIVQETNVAALRRGSLFIVTCKGGSLGREGDHDVIIPDINVSKFHLKFSYDQKKATYRVLDLGSRNGTLLNGARMAPTMQESDPVPLAHGDVLELNGTRLLCHVHDGASTCAKCEPGLLMRGDEIGGAAASGGGGAEDGDKIVNPVSHREGLKLLQKRYGLEDESKCFLDNLFPLDKHKSSPFHRVR